MKTKQYIRNASVALLVLVLFFFVSRPDSVPVILLFIPYAILGVVAYYSWMATSGAIRTHASEDRIARMRVAAGIFAAFTMIAAGLSSLGEFTFRDFLVTTLLAVGSYFYVTRTVLK